MQPLVGKYLSACFGGLKDRNNIVRKYNASAIGHLIGVAKVKLNAYCAYLIHSISLNFFFTNVLHLFHNVTRIGSINNTIICKIN